MVLLARRGATGAGSDSPSSCCSCASVSEPRSWPVAELTNPLMSGDSSVLLSTREAAESAEREATSGTGSAGEVTPEPVKKGESSASAAELRSVGLKAMRSRSRFQPARSSRSSSAKPSATSGFMPPLRACSSARHASRSYLSVSRRL